MARTLTNLDLTGFYNMVAKLTDDQVAALNHFGGVNHMTGQAGAVWFEGRWIFRQDLRDDAALASRYMESVI